MGLFAETIVKEHGYPLITLIQGLINCANFFLLLQSTVGSSWRDAFPPLLALTRPSSQKKTRKAAASHVVTYYCAQIEGEQTKRKPTTRTRMKRYHCAGWLHITIMNSRDQLTRIRMTHSEAHPHYVDTKEVEMVKLSDHNDANDAFSDMGGHQMGGIISDEGDHDADMHTVEEAGPGSSAGEDYPWEHMGYDAGGGYGGEGSLYQEPPAGDSLTRGANEPYVNSSLPDMLFAAFH